MAIQNLRRFLPSRPRGFRARAVVEGRAHELELDILTEPLEAHELLAMLRGLPRGSHVARRLRESVTPAARDRVVDALVAPRSGQRELAAQLCGRLEIDQAVPWLEARLIDRNRRVRLAAARALGRIAGWRSADALLRAAGRARIPNSRLCVELAKAAPHLFLEQVVADPEWEAQRPAAITALGLRRHGRLSLEALMSGGPSADPAELRAVCHVLAGLGDRTSVPYLFGLLDHADHDVRAAADHALQRIHRTAFGRPMSMPLHLVGRG